MVIQERIAAHGPAVAQGHLSARIVAKISARVGPTIPNVTKGLD